jgi:hypothetical protein
MNFIISLLHVTLKIKVMENMYIFPFSVKTFALNETIPICWLVFFTLKFGRPTVHLTIPKLGNYIS